MPGENGSTKPADPFEAFRGMRDAYLDAMSKAMIEAVNTEEYAQASGAMLNSALTLTAPFREVLDKSMVTALKQLSLPSRQEVAALAQRFSNMEMRLDDMDAKLDRLIELKSADRPPVSGSVPGVKRAAPVEGKTANKGNTRKG
jgi:hypothetical protein